MSDEEKLNRKVRMWLYVIALLHLVYLGLLNRPAPPGGEAHRGDPLRLAHLA